MPLIRSIIRNPSHESERAGPVLESMKRGLRHGWIVLKDAAGFAWAGLRNMASFTAGAARRRANEYREQAQNRAAQARAAREERREQMARERAEAEQRAALVQQERMEDAARQHELQRQQHLAEVERRQADAFPISSPVHDGPVAEPASVQSASPVSATSVVRPAPRVWTRKN